MHTWALHSMGTALHRCPPRCAARGWPGTACGSAPAQQPTRGPHGAAAAPAAAAAAAPAPSTALHPAPAGVAGGLPPQAAAPPGTGVAPAAAIPLRCRPAPAMSAAMAPKRPRGAAAAGGSLGKPLGRGYGAAALATQVGVGPRASAVSNLAPSEHAIAPSTRGMGAWTVRPGLLRGVVGWPLYRRSKDLCKLGYAVFAASKRRQSRRRGVSRGPWSVQQRWGAAWRAAGCLLFSLLAGGRRWSGQPSARLLRLLQAAGGGKGGLQRGHSGS